MPKLTIDGQEIEVENGTSILQAAQQLGIEVPHFCYHDRLSVPANCRMCLVEIEGGPPKPAASCAMACGDGMVVKTQSDMVKKARKGVMEMMLINHPLDCPICDQGGECDLQDQAMGYGFDRSRYHENKRAVKDKDLGPLVKTVMTRCINCTRCVRFAEEVAGTPVMGQFHRGEDAEIGTFIDQVVDTELSGNMIDICPVGALTSKPYAFKARPWELRKTPSIDVMDAVGCNIRIDSKGREVMRILPRLHEDINEEWIDDVARFSYDGLKQNRIDRPYIRNDKNKLVETDWDTAFKTIAEKMKNIKGKNIAGLIGDHTTVEETVALKDLLISLGSDNMDCRTDGAIFDPSKRYGYLFNATIAGIEEADEIILIGANPRFNASLINARINKVVRENRIPVSLLGEAVNLNYKYNHIGETFAQLDKFIKGKKKSKNPMIIVGADTFAREDGMAIHHKLADIAEKMGASLNILHNAASRVGALEVGFVPQNDGKNIHEILSGTKDGSIKALIMMGTDEFNAREMIGWKCFTIYIGHHGDHGAQRADVVLPAAAYTEKDGIMVNTEGRPQLLKRAVSPPGQAKEDWKIIRALSEYIGETLPYNNLGELRARIGKDVPHLLQIDQIKLARKAKIGKKGTVKKDKLKLSKRNFYLKNPIARASATMQQCVARFQPKQIEKKAA